jgi:hypothetical protein
MFAAVKALVLGLIKKFGDYESIINQEHGFATLCAERTASMPFFKKHPCFTTYFFATAKKSRQKRPLATKVLNRTKRLILGSFQMSPSNFHSNGVLAICP